MNLKRNKYFLHFKNFIGYRIKVYENVLKVKIHVKGNGKKTIVS